MQRVCFLDGRKTEKRGEKSFKFWFRSEIFHKWLSIKWKSFLCELKKTEMGISSWCWTRWFVFEHSECGKHCEITILFKLSEKVHLWEWAGIPVMIFCGKLFHLRVNNRWWRCFYVELNVYQGTHWK